MTAVVVVLFALVACLLLAGVAPTLASSVPYFRATESSKWQLDTSAAGSLNSAPADSTSSSSSTRAAATEPVSFHWFFPLRNLDWLRAEVEETSNPASPRWLQRESEETIDATIGPSSAEKEEVRVWLLANGIADSDLTVQRHSLKVRSTVGVVEQLFNTTMHRYRHTANSRSAVVARSSVYVPAALAPRLDALSGVYNFPHSVYKVYAIRSSPRTATSKDSSNSMGSKTRSRSNSSHSMHTMQTEETNARCSSAGGFSFAPVLAPKTLASQYNFDPRDTSTTAQSTRAAVGGGFGSTDANNKMSYEAFSQADLSHFQTNIGFSQSFNPQAYGNTNNAANLALNKASTNVGPTDEASLDIQAVRATAHIHSLTQSLLRILLWLFSPSHYHANSSNLMSCSLCYAPCHSVVPHLSSSCFSPAPLLSTASSP